MRERMERFSKYMEYKGLNDNQVTVQCNLSNGLIGQARSGKSDIGARAVDKILNVYQDLSRVWLLTGEGSMLQAASAGARENGDGTECAVEGSGHVIHYFPDVTGTMGDMEWLERPGEGFVKIVLPGYRDCKYAINAFGDSMLPTISPGSIILLSEWTERFIEWGKIYVVVTSSGKRIVKRLMPSSDSECVKCISDNTDAYPAFDIPKSSILRLYSVRGWVRRDTM